MSEAYKCNRCKKFFEGVAFQKLSDWPNIDWDLCKKCFEDMKKFFWGKENE